MGFSEYSRDSFDRFGDDLCEELLRYLSLEQCFRCECVTRQWSRVLFNRQNRLEITNLGRSEPSVWGEWREVRPLGGICLLTVRHSTVELVLKKCRITAIVFGLYVFVDEEIIATIGRHCAQLKHIVIKELAQHIGPQTWRSFGEQCGHSLRTLSIAHINVESLPTLLSLTPNLVANYGTIKLSDIAIWNVGQQFVPKLVMIGIEINNNRDMFEMFCLFSDLFADRLERIELFSQLSVRIENEELIHAIFQQLCRYKRLKALEIHFSMLNKYESFQSGLSLIAKSCRKLQYLRFECLNKCNLDGVCHSFDSLRRLSMRSFDGSVRCLACCPRLRCLEIESGTYRSHTFDDIRSYAPELRTVTIGSSHVDIYELLAHLSELRNLHSIRINSWPSMRVTDSRLCDLIGNCLGIRRVCLSKIIATQDIVDAFAELARSRVKLNCFLSIDKQFTANDVSIKVDTFSDTRNELPINLRVRYI